MNRPSLLAGLALLALALPVQAQYPKTPPAPGPLKPAPFPPFQEAVLPNGLRIVVVENHKQPVVSLSLAFAAGGSFDPGGKEGLADMMAGLLTKGAGKRTAEQIAEAIEGAGGALNAGAGTDFLNVNASVLTPSLPLAFELMGDVILRPAFADKEVELLRTQTLSGLEVEKSQPAAIAARALRRAVYGGHPYGRGPLPASVKALTRADIVAFHRDRLRPSGALLVITGDVTLAQARRLAVQALQGWLGVPKAAPVWKSPPVRTKTELVLVHRPGSVQSNILVGNLGTTPTDPRNYALTVASKVLGGGSDSRLFAILREEKSWTYGAYSSVSRRKAAGSFVASAEVRTEVTDSALAEMMHQLRRMSAEPVPAAELDNAKGALIGGFPLSIETADQVAGAVSDQKLYGLPADYVQTYRVKLGAITTEQVTAAAKAFIRPDAAVIVVVGDGAKIYDLIKGTAPTTIVDVDGKTLVPTDLIAKVGALPIDLAALSPRQDSLAILVQGNQLGALTATLEKTATGFRYVEGTRIGGFLEQNTVVLTDSMFQPLSVKQTGKVQGQETKIDVAFEKGRAKGNATTPGPQGIKAVEVDATFAPESMEENLVQAVLPALPWADGAKWTFNLFATGSGETRLSTLAVTGRETVTVPAGTAECYKAELTGGPQTAHFWVTTTAPHRLMKLTIVGAPIEMVRVK